MATRRWGGAAVSSIQFDPDNPKIVLASTGRGSTTGQIWRSADGGTTWSPVSGAPGGSWSTISVGTKSTTGARNYYGALEGDGIYVSSNSGTSWSKLPLFLPFNEGVGGEVGLKVVASKASPTTVYVVDAAVINGVIGDGRIFKSTDSGSSWLDVTGTYFDGAAYNDLRQLITTPGANWSQCSYDLQATTAAVPAVINGASTVLDTLYVGGITISGTTSLLNSNLWTDFGQTENADSAITHSDQHAMSISPTNPSVALFGNDGGIYGLTYTPNSTGGTWTTATNSGTVLNQTLGLTQIYHADFANNNPSLIVMGTQDNASPTAVGDLANWSNPGAGDGGGCAINQQNTNIQYNSSQNLGLEETLDDWQTQGSIVPMINNKAWDGDPTPFVSTVVVNPTNGSVMFTGTDYLWMWNSDSQSWIEHVGSTQLSSTGLVQAIACAPQDATNLSNTNLGTPSTNGVVYVSTTDGKLWMTVNATAVNGTTSTAKWVEIDTSTGALGLPDRVISSISVNPTNPFDILVGVSGTGTQHVFRCADTSGAPVLLFTPQDGVAGQAASLPDISVNDITRDPVDTNNTFYVATDIGVFMTINGGTTWQNATEPLGLPNVQCNTIKAVGGASNDNLYVGTFGRGLWKIPLAGIATPTPVAPSLSVKAGISRSGANIQLAIVITNTSGATGSAATNVVVSAANLVVGKTTTPAITIPINVGTIQPGQSVTAIANFPGLTASTGSIGSYSGTVTFTGGSVTIPTTTIRMP